MAKTEDYIKHLLPNGLRLITAPMPHAESLTCMIYAGTGSRFEDKKVNGISHFLEHMLFKGTKKRPNSLAITSTIDGIGGEFNAFTAKDHTAYFVKALPAHQDTALDVLTDMVLHSQFPAKNVRIEKGVVLQEIALYNDLPHRKVYENFESLIFSGCPLGWEITGTPASVKSITRPDFISYISTHYYPENLVVVIAGKVTSQAALATTQKYLGHLKSSGKARAAAHDRFSQFKPQSHTTTKKTEQSHLMVGFRGFPRGHPTRYAEAVLAALLAGPMSSRLFQEIRDKRGLAYYVRSEIGHYEDAGYFAIHSGVKTNSVKEAIQVILGEFHQLVTKRVGDKPLSIAKEYVKGNLVLDLEDSMEKARLYGEQELLEGKIKTPEQILAAIDKVTSEKLKQIATQIVKPEGLNLALIGPHQPQEFDNLLK